MNRIYYMLDENEEKYLPFQYYNLFNYISLPMVGKKCLIPGWSKKTETVHPVYIDDNIGLLTGEINNLTVLDIDVKDNGMKVWKKFNRNIITPTVKSPGGSIHLYFKYTPDLPNMNRIYTDEYGRVGWDVKNNGSIITSPPSIYPGTNKRYRWMPGLSLNDINPIKIPIWLKKYILNHLK